MNDYSTLAHCLTAGTQQTEQLWQALWDQGPDALWICSNGRVVDCNAAAAKLLGCPDVALLKAVDPFQFGTDPTDRPTATPGQYRWTCRTFEGKDVPVEVHIHSLAGEDNPTLLVWRELPRCSPTSADPALVSELEGIRRAGGELLCRVAQEMREPLSRIVQMALLLREGTCEPEQRRFAESVAASGRQLLTGISDVLDLAKLESGQMSLHATPFDLELSVSDAIDSLAPAAEVKGLDLLLRYSAALPRRVVGDAGRLRQVLYYLAKHSLDHTMRGSVFIELDRLDSENGGILLRGKVRSAAGQPDSAKLSETAEKSSAAGTGNDLIYIGLAIAKRVINLMNGTLEFRHERGSRERGMNLTFTVPLQGDADGWTEASGKGILAGQTSLVVWKNALGRSILREHLTRLGMNVQESCNCAAARLESIFNPSAPRPDFVFVETQTDPDWEELGQQIAQTWEEKPPICLELAPANAASSQIRLERAGYSSTLSTALLPRAIREKLGDLAGADARQLPKTGREQGLARLIAPRVLVILSDAKDRVQALQALAQRGCRVESASESSEIAQLVHEKALDLVLLDLEAPEVDGRAFVTEIRRMQPSGRLPIVGVLRNDAIEIGEDALVIGVSEVLSGPLDDQNLSEVLGRWVDRAGTRSAFERGEVLRRCGGDEWMLAELSEELRQQAGRQLRELQRAAGHKNEAKTLALTRRIQSQASFFSARQVLLAANRLGDALRVGDWAAVLDSIGGVRVQLLRLTEQLPARTGKTNAQ